MCIVFILSFVLASLSVTRVFGQARDDRGAQVRTDTHASSGVSAQSTAPGVPADSPASQSVSTQSDLNTNVVHPTLPNFSDPGSAQDSQSAAALASSSRTFTFNTDLGAQIKYCIVFPFLNSLGSPIPTFNVPTCRNATSTTVVSGGGITASTSTSTIPGTVGTSTAATSSPSSGGGSAGGNSGGGGGGGGSSPANSGSSSGSGGGSNGPPVSPSLGAGGGGPSGQVLGAATSTLPGKFSVSSGGKVLGMPNTGAGGEALLNILILLLSGFTALLGSMLLYFQTSVASRGRH
jgi:hypothetical protein